MNPLQEGASDPKALEIADLVVEALGGRQNYDQTRYLSWRFFGRRFHVWDKHQSRARVEDGKGAVTIIDLQTKEGKSWQDGEPITDEAELAKRLENAYAAWVNDSYWLVMPYKLRDPGVTLRYTREDTTPDGAAARVLTLTFEEVGLTPENRYEVYVDKATNRVVYWAFFQKADDAEPRMTTPWSNWQSYGKIMLPSNFGKYDHTDVAAYQELPETVFTSPAAVELP
jgi:hypothetical protein